MKKHFVLAAVGSALCSAVVGAQANSCPAGGSATTPAGAQANVVRDACLQAVDLFNFVAPQLGLALTGGNATLGQGGTMGGLGHFSIGIRGNVFNGDLPQPNQFPAPRNQQSPTPEVLQSKKQVLPLPVADAAIGIFRGFPVGMTNVGGIDLLVSAQYVPSIGTVGEDDVVITPQSNLKFGFGARVGLLQESLVVPGVAVTYFKRDVPTTNITGTSSQVDLAIKDASIRTSAWRVVASKSFIMFGLAAGAGQDKYDQSTTVSGTVKNQSLVVGGVTVNTGTQPFNVSLAQTVTRTNFFGDLSINLPLFKIVFEGGQVSGASPTIPQVNSFSSGKADDSRVYGSFGLRFAW